MAINSQDKLAIMQSALAQNRNVRVKVKIKIKPQESKKTPTKKDSD